MLLFAPHPDDETLAAGGFLWEAVRRGARVQVTFLTDGDAFPAAAALRYRRWPGPDVLRRLGTERREEGRRALAHLGVKRFVFLGARDRGLSTLWSARWRPGGVKLLQQVESLLRNERPDLVLYPDPADDHPDHRAAHAFVQMALERLGSPARRRTYLVHRGLWPGGGPPLTPPVELAADAAWESLPLSPEALAAKRRALAEHRTQTAAAGSFLRRFRRGNELFASRVVARVGSIPSLLADPAADRWGRVRVPGGDFASLTLQAGEDEVLVRMHLRGPRVPGIDYRLHWRPLDGPIAESLRSERVTPAPQGTDLYSRLRLLPHTLKLMLDAEAWAGPVLLDRTPWRTVMVDSDRPRR